MRSEPPITGEYVAVSRQPFTLCEFNRSIKMFLLGASPLCVYYTTFAHINELLNVRLNKLNIIIPSNLKYMTKMNSSNKTSYKIILNISTHF